MRARLVVFALLVGLAPAAESQTPADTAAVVLQVARNLERDGKRDAARELLQYLHSRYGETPAARTADSLLRSLPGISGIGTGRTGFVTFNTAYGAFLGAAIPAAFDAHGTGAYGVGLLVGAPAGFFLSRAFARAHFRSSGQAGMASFLTAWGTWQGLVVQKAFKIGEDETCGDFGCFNNDSETAPWAAMSLGGITGLGVGWAVAAANDIRPGTATLISNSALWGTWFGLTLGDAAGLEDAELWKSMLVVGNAALLAAIPAAKAWQPTSSRVRLVTAAGLAGGLAGFGINLIADPNDAEFAIPAATSALGLIVGALATRHQRDLDSGADGVDRANALFQWRDGLRLSPVLPEPATFPILDQRRRPRQVPGARFRIFDARF